jgi:hypothetical protein
MFDVMRRPGRPGTSAFYPVPSVSASSVATWAATAAISLQHAPLRKVRRETVGTLEARHSREPLPQAQPRRLPQAGRAQASGSWRLPSPQRRVAEESSS